MSQMKRKYTALSKSPASGSIFISTVDVDHEGDRMFPEGVDLTAYLKNPVVLWLHDAYGSTASAGIPIGASKRLRVVPGRGIEAAGIDWLEGDDFSDRVRNAWDQGKIRAASVGFQPVEFEPNEHGGHDITRWTLLEWSLVPVPANPAAVRGGLAAAVKGLNLDAGLFERGGPVGPARVTAAAIRAGFARALALERCKPESPGATITAAFKLVLAKRRA